jgi:hypothetical protein
MGYWDCPGCGQKRIQGPERSCPGCGRPRDPSVAFYTTDDAPAVEAPEQVARARAGADWQCPYCGADNPRGSVQCVGCGATSEGAKSRTEKLASDAPAPPKAVPKSSAAPKVLAILLFVLALLGFGIWALFVRAKPLTVTVERAAWVKALDIERKKTETREAWHDEVPAGAREIRRYSAERKKHVHVGTEKVKTGKKDLGNGYFEDIYTERPKYEDRMVEDTKVVFEIDRWVQDRTLKNESTDGKEPELPHFAGGPNERIGRRENKIALELRGDDQKSYSFDVDLESDPGQRARVADYSRGKSFTAYVNAVGVVRKLEPR